MPEMKICTEYSKVRLQGTHLLGTSGYKELIFIPQP